MAKREINIDDLPANNLDGRPPKKEVAPVVKGRVRTTEGRHTFARNVQAIGGHLFEDVVLPAIKGIVSEFFNNGLEMLLWGTDRRPSSRGRTSRPTNYNKQYSPRAKSRGREHRGVSDNMGMTEISFASRTDAYATLDRMEELLSRYAYVTVGDLRSLAGLSSAPRHEKYGWHSLRSASVQWSRGGHIINLPEPEYIE